MNFTIPSVVRHKETSALLVIQDRYPKSKYNEAGYRCSPIDDRSMTKGYTADELEPAPPRKPGAFDFKSEIVPRAQGSIPWEHVEPAKLSLMLSNVAACGSWEAYPGVAWVKKPGALQPSWARIFLDRTQGGAYTGQAHALVYESGPYTKPQHLRDGVVAAAVKAVHDPKNPAGDLAAAVLAMSQSPRTESPMPSAWKLSICKHEIVDRSTPEGRMRGWHPKHCAKCGINLSVDSSD